MLKGFAFLKTSWLFSEVGTKKPVESDSKIDFSRDWWNSSFGSMAGGEAEAEGWGSGGGVETFGEGDLGRMARRCSEVSVGVALAETEMSGKGDESGGGVFPSIWIILKWGDFLVGVGVLELIGTAGKISSLNFIFAEWWASWLFHELELIKLVEVDWLSGMDGWFNRWSFQYSY